jgi:hypothetical protein
LLSHDLLNTLCYITHRFISSAVFSSIGESGNFNLKPGEYKTFLEKENFACSGH